MESDSPKKLIYSSNIDIVYCLIVSNKVDYFKVLLAWIGVTIQFDDKVEKTLTTLLSLLSEGAVFKLLDGTTLVIFNQNSIYLKLLESHDSVDINGDSESKGSLRILKSLLSDKLNPHLNYSSGDVTVKDDVEKLQNYQKGVDTFLCLSSIKGFETNEINFPSDYPKEVFDDKEANRIATGENILLYGCRVRAKAGLSPMNIARKIQRLNDWYSTPTIHTLNLSGRFFPMFKTAKLPISLCQVRSLRF